jgi:hypothetical protein
MTIHLISDYLSIAISKFLVDYSSKFFSSKVKFQLVNQSIDHFECWSWDNVFAVGRAIKSQQTRVEGEDFFVVLISGTNEHNWFSAFDTEDPSVGFLQTTGWEKYKLDRPEYAVAYHLISLITIMKFFGHDPNPYRFYHHKGVGCMFDFTGFKEEVMYKLKSAHICPDCIHSIARHSVDNPQAFSFIKGVTDLLENVRTHLFQVDYSGFFNNSEYRLIVNEDLSSELKINGEQIPLPISKGREAAVFIMLLKYENGLTYQDFQKPRFKEEYVSLYHRYFVQNATLESLIKQADLEIAQKTYKSNLHTTISKIKRKLTATLKQYPVIQNQVMIKSQDGTLIIPIKRSSLDPRVPEFALVG